MIDKAVIILNIVPCLGEYLSDVQFKASMQYINNFKSLVLADSDELEQRRLSISTQELQEHWQGKTLSEMSQILTICDEYIVNFLVSLLQPYLSSRKLQYEAYIVYRSDREDQPLLYCYDCKIFRNPLYTLEENQFISAFLLCFRQNAPLAGPLYQLVETESLQPNRWALRVKQSAILKTQLTLQETMGRLPYSCDKIVLPPHRYYHFIQEWMKCYYYSNNIQATVSNFFKGIMVLCENQMLLDYFASLTPSQQHERMYARPIRLIDRPKNVEQFTLIEHQRFREIPWHTLKIVAYRLKYRVEEREEGFACFRIKEQKEGGVSFDLLSQEDQSILIGFQLQKEREEVQ